MAYKTFLTLTEELKYILQNLPELVDENGEEERVDNRIRTGDLQNHNLKRRCRQGRLARDLQGNGLGSVLRIGFICCTN